MQTMNFPISKSLLQNYPDHHPYIRLDVQTDHEVKDQRIQINICEGTFLDSIHLHSFRRKNLKCEISCCQLTSIPWGIEGGRRGVQTPLGNNCNTGNV